MTDAMGVALITTTGTILGLILKRQFDVTDRRYATTENEREECERYKDGFRAVVHIARQLRQTIVAIEELRKIQPDYAMARLTDLAQEGDEAITRCCDFVAGKIQNLE